MKVGATGTRNDLNLYQLDCIANYLQSIYVPNIELHHGDCAGADNTIAEIAKSLNYKIVCHPPNIDTLRAFAPYDEIRKPLSYFARNRNIVDETDILMVAPYQNAWQPKGGTWYTHDYALSKSKPIKIFFPSLKQE